MLVNQGPQPLAASVLLGLFDSVGHVHDPRYLKQFIFVFSGNVGLGQNWQPWVFCYFGSDSRLGVPKIPQLKVEMTSSLIFTVISIS